MFSGIIQATEKALKFSKRQDSLVLSFLIPKGWKMQKGDSVAVDGCCLTVEEVSKNSFSVRAVLETLEKTAFLELSDDHYFNIERPLRLNDFVSGHLIQGHVDTTAITESIKNIKDSRLIAFSISQEFKKYLIYKGSVAVNGVSLTVVSVQPELFTISLIPYSLSHTNLGKLKVGEKVNIEIDVIAKYIEKFSQEK